MTDRKISELGAIPNISPDSDIVPIVDVDAGQTKSVTVSDLVGSVAFGSNYDYYIDDATALSALTGMSSGERAFQRDNEHIYEYNGSSWDDLGEAPTAPKLEIEDLTDDTNINRQKLDDAQSGRYGDGAIVKDAVSGKVTLAIEPVTGKLKTADGITTFKDKVAPDGYVHILSLMQDDGTFPVAFAQSPETGRIRMGLPDTATRKRFEIGEFARTSGFGKKTRTQTLKFVGSTGQSLEVGGGLDTGAIDDTSQLAPMFIQHPLSMDMAMLDTGLIWSGSSAIPTVTDLVPAREAFRVNGAWRGQSQGSGYMMQTEMLYREEDGVIHPQAYFAFGQGGTAIADLGTGSQSFLNGVAGITAAYNLAADYGLNFNYTGTCWTHGHNDRNSDYATYLSLLISLKNDLKTEINTITGGDGTYPFVMFQLCAGGTAATGSGSEPSTPALAVLEAADTEADMFVIGPTYQYATVDGTHGDAVSYDMMGELAAYVMKRADEGDWNKACEVTNVSRTGTTITVTVNVPEGDLIVDETTLPSATNYGFTYSGANITNVSVGTTSGGTCDVTITIDADAGGVLSYAWAGDGVSRDPETGLYPHASAWGNLRDDALIPCVTHGNKRLAHWLCVYETTVA